MSEIIKDLSKYNVLGTEFRAGQEEYITKMIQFSQDPTKKYMIFQGNVGIGKSLVALTSAKYISKNDNKTVFITSPKNILVDQYQHDYDKFMTVMKGGANYDCLMLPDCKYDHGPCHNTKCGVKNCPKASICPYRQAFANAKKDSIVLTNMHWLLCTSNISGLLPTRDLLIIDEAHSLDSTLLDFLTISYSGRILTALSKIVEHAQTNNFILYRKLRKDQLNLTNLLNIGLLENINPTNIDEISVLIDSIKFPIQEAKNEFDRVLKDFDAETLHSKEIPAWNEFNRDYNLLKNFLSKVDWFNYLKGFTPWLCDPTIDFKTKEITGFTVKPINALALAKIILPKIAHKVVFMSATIGKKEQFCKDLGVPDNTVEYVETESDFPKDKRPVYRDFVGVFNKANQETYLQNAVKKIDELLDKYPNYKGLIHTTTFTQCEYIQAHSKHRTRLLTHTTKDKPEVVEMFMKSNNAVLCSPSCKEGLDLKDDLCRFQIIVKVPWGDLTDKVVQVRLKEDPVWYANEAIKNLEQAYGRGMRSKTDWCDCYILDQSFQRLLGQHMDLFSKYFLEALV